MIDMLANKTTDYTYDALDRLTRARTYPTSATVPDETSTCVADARLACYEYTIDDAGNRTSRIRDGSKTQWRCATSPPCWKRRDAATRPGRC